jgi:hypothetical protein
VLKGGCYEIFTSGFFHESVSPKSLIIPLGPEIAAQGLPLVSLTPVANGKNPIFNQKNYYDFFWTPLDSRVM